MFEQEPAIPHGFHICLELSGGITKVYKRNTFVIPAYYLDGQVQVYVGYTHKWIYVTEEEYHELCLMFLL